MLMPWTKIYSCTYLTNEGWKTPTIPTEDFFQFRASSVFLDIPSSLRISVSFGRKYHYRVWRDWFPFFKEIPVAEFITINLDKTRMIREDDGSGRFGKRFSLNLNAYDLVELRSCNYRKIHDLLTKRIMNRIVFDLQDLTA